MKITDDAIKAARARWVEMWGDELDRAGEVYRKASERREGTLGESPAHQRYRWLEATARGIEDGAQDIAALLGVEEHEIEEPDAGPEAEGCHCNGCIGMGPCDDDLGKSDDGDLIDCPACLADHYGLPGGVVEHNHESAP